MRKVAYSVRHFITVAQLRRLLELWNFDNNSDLQFHVPFPLSFPYYLIYCPWLHSLLASVQLQCTICTSQAAACVHTSVSQLLWWKFSVINLLWKHVVVVIICKYVEETFEFGNGHYYVLYVIKRDKNVT